MGVMEDLNREHVARQRWRLLAEAVRNKKSEANNNAQMLASTRRFSWFGLIHCSLVKEDLYKYSCPKFSDFKVVIRHVTDKPTAEDLIGFNNTGNLCVWPSEEVLAYYCMKHSNLFTGKNILELGGGMTCLAALAILSITQPSKVILSDGNAKAAQSLRRVVEDNRFPVQVVARELRWDKPSHVSPLTGQFDIILCADCLFFEEGRESLVHALYSLLGNEGIALVMAPARGGTLEKFIDIADKFFELSYLVEYDMDVSALLKKLESTEMRFSRELHYPQLVILRKL